MNKTSVFRFGFTLVLLATLGATGCNDKKNAAVYQPAVAKLIESAQTFKTANQPGKALCRLEAAADLAPETYQVQYNLGVLASEQNRWDLAIPHLVKATALAPNDANAWYTLAYTYESMGDVYMGRVQVTRPEDINALPMELRKLSKDAASQHAHASYAKAVESYQRFLDVAPDSDPGRPDAENQVQALQSKLKSGG